MSGNPRLFNLCGRIHFGPVCVNGGDRSQAICEACGRNVNRRDREQVQASKDVIRHMLAKYSKKQGERK